MKLKILSVIAFIAFTAFAIQTYSRSENKLEFQKVKIQSTQAELKQLQLDYKLLDKKQEQLKQDKDATDVENQRIKQEKEDILKREQELERQLSAKKEAQRVATAKLNSVATATATASASSLTGCDKIRATLSSLGVPANQMDSAITLAMRESSCDEFIVNSIGACGAFQSLPCGKWGAPGTEEYYRGAINYANSRYGGYNGALAHSYANNWY